MRWLPLIVLTHSLMAIADVETDRLGEVAGQHPDLGAAAAHLTRNLRAEPRKAGEELWRRALAEVSNNADDRPLYWARLSAVHDQGRLRAHRHTFERASRGFSSIEFDEDAVKVLITGFDPFRLDANIDQSNPSGLAALLLDNKRLALKEMPGRARSAAHIRSAVFPVRFQDFDDGIVEELIEPLLTAGAMDLLITISMGRDGFDLERFPGRRRSAPGSDNLGILTGASERKPLVPRLGADLLDGPEFLEFSLPAQVMIKVDGRWSVRDNRNVTTLEQGNLRASSLRMLDGQTAVRGSGGGYLSNEIAYRCLHVRSRLDSSIPMGHIHTPALAGFNQFDEVAMVEQITDLIRAAAETLND
jgi:pyrrolidone-carboxylate peptidase